MAVNSDKPQLWKADIARSVDFYNDWFLRFAPGTFRSTRAKTSLEVKAAFQATDYLRRMDPSVLEANPGILPTLRMATAPPIARDRLIGLSGSAHTLVGTMESDQRVPPRMTRERLQSQLRNVGEVFSFLIDLDLFPWLQENRDPTPAEIDRAASVVADRLCGAQADPIIRNAQEQRQLAAIKDWLDNKGYQPAYVRDGSRLAEMPSGTYSFRLNVPVTQQATGRARTVNIPIDVVVRPILPASEKYPVLIEAKSAGDFTNTNKRRKEEATKAAQLKSTYGPELHLALFLCGYFDSGYLGYEAAEGIDFVWEHRIDELQGLGL